MFLYDGQIPKLGYKSQTNFGTKVVLNDKEICILCFKTNLQLKTTICRLVFTYKFGDISKSGPFRALFFCLFCGKIVSTSTLFRPIIYTLSSDTDGFTANKQSDAGAYKRKKARQIGFIGLCSRHKPMSLSAGAGLLGHLMRLGFYYLYIWDGTRLGEWS